MEDRSILRRTLVTSSVTAGLVGTAGCLLKQQPDASHWAAGIRWSDPPGEVFVEVGFVPSGGGYLTGRNYPTEYLRVNGGELNELDHHSYEDDSVPADRGDHVEFVIDFDDGNLGKETVFEYTIPDDDLVGVLAGFAECLHYRDTDEWVVRPLNVDLDTDLLGRQTETLLVRVSRERRDDDRDWFVWGHTESIREAFRDRAGDKAIEFLDPGEAATFAPASFFRVRMEVADGAERITRVTYPEPDADT